MEKIIGYTYCYDCNNIFNGITKFATCPECESEKLQIGLTDALIEAILKEEELEEFRD